MTDDPAYFLYHSIGHYPEKEADLAAALNSLAQDWSAMDDRQWPVLMAARAEYLELWRALIDAPVGSVISAENVTSALFSVIGGLPKEYLSGKKVLIASDCFPSLHFLLNGLQERMGFTLETVPMRQGDHWVQDEDILSAWDETVGVALLTFVSSTTSHRSDVDVLLAHGKRMGSLVGIDITQAAGLLPFSVQQTPADFVVSTSLKWLCGTPGAGIIQMRPDLIGKVQPDLRGWFSQDNPFAWDLDTFEFAPDARRFDNGTPSMLACLATVPALKWHAQQTGILDHNRHLAAAIIELAQEAGLRIVSPLDEAERGGSVMIQLDDRIDPTALVGGLRERRIHVDTRGHTLRISPGIMTEMRHVERLFKELPAFLK